MVEGAAGFLFSDDLSLLTCVRGYGVEVPNERDIE